MATTSRISPIRTETECPHSVWTYRRLKNLPKGLHGRDSLIYAGTVHGGKGQRNGETFALLTVARIGGPTATGKAGPDREQMNVHVVGCFTNTGHCPSDGHTSAAP